MRKSLNTEDDGEAHTGEGKDALSYRGRREGSSLAL